MSTLDIALLTASYTDKQSIKDDYLAIIKLHYSVNVMQTFDAAIIHKNSDGKVSIIRKTEEGTGQSTWIGAITGLAISLLVVFSPGIELVGGLFNATLMSSVMLVLLVTLSTILGGLVGTYIAHARGGMSKIKLKKLAKTLSAGEYMLIVIALTEASHSIETAMRSAEDIKMTMFKTKRKYLQKEIAKTLTSL